MNDETNPASSEPTNPPAFNPEVPPFAAPIASPPPPKPLSYWLKKLLVCNPFYLASAALLLYGVSRISLDATFFTTEIRQLTFNFSALQVYELLLTATATLLLTRRIWYDASLLVVLENLLWIVPFILVSQAAFIDQRSGIYLCVLAFGLAIARVVWLRTRARDIVPSPKALLCGLPILLVNAAWPVVYRHFGESKIGINIPGAASAFHDFSWFWLLPALATLLLFLPRPETNHSTSQMRRWFPILLFGFWLVGTGVHLYALGYVYDFKLRREQLAPLLWVLAWAMQTRLADFMATPPRAFFTSTLFLPVLATLPAVLVAESRVFFYLSTLNLVAYAIRLLLQPDSRLVLQLSLVSFALMVAAVPIDFAPLLARPLTQTNLIGIAALAYVIVGVILSRNPKIALLGALAAMIVSGTLRQAHGDWFHWAVQAGFVYFLLHSLRWQDEEHRSAIGIRIFVTISWVLHTFFWVRGGATLVEPLLMAGVVLVAWIFHAMIMRSLQLLLLPIAAALVALCSPVNFMIVKVQAAPTGVLYVVGSFALFGLGTVVALTKHRWHKHHQP